MPDVRADAEKAVQAVLDEAGPTLQALSAHIADHPIRGAIGFLVLDLSKPESRAIAVSEMGGGAAGEQVIDAVCDRSGLRQVCRVETLEQLRAFYLAQGGTEAAWTRGIEGAPSRGVLPNARPAIVATGQLVAITWIMFANLSKGGSA